MPTALTTISELTPHMRALRALGYTTLEQPQGAAAAARPLLERFLNADLDQLLGNIPFAAPSDDPAELALIENAVYPLGVEIDAVPRLESAPMMAAYAELPSS